MSAEFRFFMDRWIERPLAGLPLRMIFLSRWHVIHARVIAVAGLLFAAGKFFNVPALTIAAFVAGGPSALCFLMFPALAIVFIVLEGIARLWKS